MTITRLIMSGAIVLFDQGSVMQFSVGLLTMFAAFGLQLRFMPCVHELSSFQPRTRPLSTYYFV